MSDEPDDIEADVRAAFADDPAPAAAPAPVRDAAPAAPVEAPAPVRDATGKFAPAPASAPAPAEPVASPEAIAPPSSWSAVAKAKFATLDPEVQAEVVRRERDMDKGLQERASKLKQYEPLETVLAPIRDRLSMSGVSEAQYLQALISADNMLRGPNAQQALAQLARQYGINPQAFTPSPQQPQGTPDPGVHPMLAQLQSQVSTLVQSNQQAQQQAQAQAKAQIDSTIDTFSKDPANLYFENVRPRMAALLSSGQAADLKDAYEQACWSDPTVRPLVLADQAKANAASAQATAGAKVQAARAAGGSVVGAPGAGGSPASRASNPNSSIEDEVRAAFASHRA